MRSLLTAVIVGLGVGLLSTGCCRQCDLCDDVGGPCGYYSLAGRYHPSLEESTDEKKAPPGEENLIPELKQHMEQLRSQNRPESAAWDQGGDGDRFWR